MTAAERFRETEEMLKQYNNLHMKIKLLEIDMEYFEKLKGEEQEDDGRLNKLEAVHCKLTARVKKLDAAIDCLKKLNEDVYNIIKALYVDNLKWDIVSMRCSLSNTSINRHRKKGIEILADLMAADYDN